MADAENQEQHNNGPGTFVGGNVTGDIWNVFLQPEEKGRPTGLPPDNQRPDGVDNQANDYEDIASPMFLSFLLGASSCMALVHAVMGWPWDNDSSPPGIVQRLAWGFASMCLLLACSAVFLARMAQAFELWSKQCADSASESQGRLTARPHAFMARAAATVSVAAASIAEMAASLYGWRSFGGEISRRARVASLNAATSARTARNAARPLAGPSVTATGHSASPNGAGTGRTSGSATTRPPR